MSSTATSINLKARAELEKRRRLSALKQQAIARAIAQLQPWARPLLEPYRYKSLYGGRGGGKSINFADALLILALQKRCRVLCGREFQNSIKDSVLYLLRDRIEELNFEPFFTVNLTEIISDTGSRFFFKGLRRNIKSIRSMAAITHCWIEEAQSTSAESWRDLVPTIREEGSEIWLSWNPYLKSDPIYQEFIVKGRENAYVREVNWRDNPHFPSTLEAERQEMLRGDYELYQHIWEGQPLERTDAQVLAGKWTVDDFTPDDDWDGPYHGADWGFGADPTVAVRCWVHQRRLYIEYESYAQKLELDHTGDRWIQDIPNIQAYEVRADSSRPESISHVRRGRSPESPPIPRLLPCVKWPGSVQDGIAHLRSYEQIVIHPRCKHAAEEARLYSYKVDRLTEQVLPQLKDGNDHIYDSVRYALGALIRPRQQAAPRPRSRVNW